MNNCHQLSAAINWHSAKGSTLHGLHGSVTAIGSYRQYNYITMGSLWVITEGELQGSKRNSSKIERTWNSNHTIMYMSNASLSFPLVLSCFASHVLLYPCFNFLPLLPICCTLALISNMYLELGCIIATTNRDAFDLQVLWQPNYIQNYSPIEEPSKSLRYSNY